LDLNLSKYLRKRRSYRGRDVKGGKHFIEFGLGIGKKTIKEGEGKEKSVIDKQSDTRKIDPLGRGVIWNFPSASRGKWKVQIGRPLFRILTGRSVFKGEALWEKDKATMNFSTVPLTKGF